MAAEKSPAKKVMDVSRPSQVAAEPTSRPVIVTNRPLITQDPMVASGADATTEDAKTTAPKQAAATTPHTEKVIKPLREDSPDTKSEPEKETAETEPFHIGSKKDDETASKASEATAEVSAETEGTGDDAHDSESGDESAVKNAKTDEVSTEPGDSESPKHAAGAEEPTEGIVEYDTDTDDKQTNPQAVKVSAEEQKRAEELEEIIASGKYFVPIDASGKRRTLIITIWLVVLTLVLAVVLVDALLDVGMLTIPGVPHTHFFSIS